MRVREGVGEGEGGPGGREASYYGITIESQRVLFVVDISGSMKEAGSAEGSSKEEEAKKELLRCLKSLGTGSAFGVFAFSDRVTKWKPGILKVTNDTKEDARRWVEELASAHSTNTFAALEEAFRISVADPRNDMGEEYGLFPDTIFLMTDGAPTTPEGKLEDGKGVPEWTKVLEGVRAWNRERRVVVHAVGVGLKINAGFLRALAEENGGKFVTVR